MTGGVIYAIKEDKDGFTYCVRNKTYGDKTVVRTDKELISGSETDFKIGKEIWWQSMTVYGGDNDESKKRKIGYTYEAKVNAVGRVEE